MLELIIIGKGDEVDFLSKDLLVFQNLIAFSLTFHNEKAD